jgi:hypothetical protein
MYIFWAYFCMLAPINETHQVQIKWWEEKSKVLKLKIWKQE